MQKRHNQSLSENKNLLRHLSNCKIRFIAAQTELHHQQLTPRGGSWRNAAMSSRSEWALRLNNPRVLSSEVDSMEGESSRQAQCRRQAEGQWLWGQGTTRGRRWTDQMFNTQIKDK